MTFNRYEVQCLDCACYIENIQGRPRKIMDEWKMECTHDRYCHQDSPCNVFIKRWNNGNEHIDNGRQSYELITD